MFPRLTLCSTTRPQALPLSAYRTANLMGSRRKYVTVLYNQITPVQPQPIFLIPANLRVTVADNTVATCKRELGSRLSRGKKYIVFNFQITRS